MFDVYVMCVCLCVLLLQALCSGRGSCSGEKCVCEEGYEGRFCERITPVSRWLPVLVPIQLCHSVPIIVISNIFLNLHILFSFCIS